MASSGKNVPLVSHCLALVFKQKQSEPTTRRSNVPAPEEFVPREIFEEFREMNCVSLWNINMEEAVRNICYVGHLVPFTILIDGDERHLQTLKVGWIKRLVRSPSGFKLEAVGEVLGTVEMTCVPQTQFIPLDEALCFIVHDLNCSGAPATLGAIRERLRSWYRDLQMPDDNVLVSVLHGLVLDVKLYQTANGYCIMTPDKAHVANWLAAQHGRQAGPAASPADPQGQPLRSQPVASRLWNGVQPPDERYAYAKLPYHQPTQSALPDSDTQAQPLYCTHEFVAESTDAPETAPTVTCGDTFGMLRSAQMNASASGAASSSSYSIASQFRRMNVREAAGDKTPKTGAQRDQPKTTKTGSKKASSVLKKLLPDRETKRDEYERPPSAAGAPTYLYQTQPLDVGRPPHSQTTKPAPAPAHTPASSAVGYQYAQAQAQALQHSASARPSRHASGNTDGNTNGNANAWSYQQLLQAQHPAAHVMPAAICAASSHSHSSAGNSIGDASASASASNHSNSNRIRLATAGAPHVATTASSSPACGRRKPPPPAAPAPTAALKRDTPLACGSEPAPHRHSQPQNAACACSACVDVHAQLETFRAAAQPAAPVNAAAHRTAPNGMGANVQPIVADSGFASSHHTESNGSANENNTNAKLHRPPSSAAHAQADDMPSGVMMYADPALVVDRSRLSPRLVPLAPYGSLTFNASHQQQPSSFAFSQSNLPSDDSFVPNSAVAPLQHAHTHDDADAGDADVGGTQPEAGDPAEYRVMGVV